VVHIDISGKVKNIIFRGTGGAGIKFRANVHGGEVNHGLFFADLPPQPLGAVSSQMNKIC
jgi:hypothetical protein